jgi:hypothetical protein
VVPRQELGRKVARALHHARACAELAARHGCSVCEKWRTSPRGLGKKMGVPAISRAVWR